MWWHIIILEEGKKKKDVGFIRISIKNIRCRLFVAAKKLQQTDTKFIAFCRMSKQCYTDLVQLIAPAIQQQNTNMRECVSAEERILITLR
jgi:hypothetical protein